MLLDTVTVSLSDGAWGKNYLA